MNLSVLIFLMILMFFTQILSKKVKNKKYKPLLLKIAGYTSLLYLIVFVIFLSIDIFRYKEYRTSGYSYAIKSEGREYTFNTDMYLIKDRLTGEFYIQLADRYKTHFALYSGGYLVNFILIDSGDYTIDKDNSIRLGTSFKYLNESESCNDIIVRNDRRQCNMIIKYQGKELNFKSSYKNIDPQLKDLDYRYGYSFTELKEIFGLTIDIEIDEGNKIVYFVKNKK